jgi:erythronate-4-phosphate dehydrogenase
LKIIVDENVPYAVDAFRTLGEVTALPGRAITAEAMLEADALIVRSVTRVGRALLERSPVRFVATATIGFDHVDVDYLRERAIGFASAPGSNANSVAEYVTAALLVLAGRKGLTLQRKTLGVVGVGNVGSLVVSTAEALGLHVLQNDPPLARQTREARFRPLQELFAADVLTLHVPLTREGPDKTFHLVDERFLGAIKKGAILLNTSRGPVVDEAALLRAIAAPRLGAVVLDVWENEPQINLETLRRVDLGTPHIAGYSLDGKVAGTVMVYEAACRFFREEVSWNASSVLPPPALPMLDVHAHDRSEEDAIGEAVKAVYDIEADDAALRRLNELPPGARGAEFDRLRRTYPVRREFYNTEIHLVHGSESLRRKLEGIGFKVRAGHPS